VSALLATEGVYCGPPPQVLVTALGDSTVTMSFAGWLDQHRTEYLRVRSEAIRMVKAHLEEAGLTMPSPEFGVELLGDRGGEPPPCRRRAPTSPPDVDGRSGRAVVPDVSVDRTLEKQIETDRQQATSPNLLDATSKVAPASKAASSP
jgi:small conductance mechanosensitive channel